MLALTCFLTIVIFFHPSDFRIEDTGLFLAGTALIAVLNAGFLLRRLKIEIKGKSYLPIVCGVVVVAIVGAVLLALIFEQRQKRKDHRCTPTTCHMRPRMF
jgi:predicted neutral ceramidase superfamily lipid hydrolase